MTQTRANVAQLLDVMHAEERAVYGQAQREYAHDEENALANFDRIAERLGLTPEQVLLVYLTKHMDGIAADAGGYRSQREDVRGRIKDARVYLALYRAMVERRCEVSANAGNCRESVPAWLVREGGYDDYETEPGPTVRIPINDEDRERQQGKF